MNTLIQALKKLVTLLETYMQPTYLWDNAANARLSVRQICDASGMPLTPTFEVDGQLYLMKDVMCACIEVESNFNPNAIHFNRDTQGNILSTDYGICQINSYWHIGEGKDFPTAEYVLQNPQADVEWMAKQFIAGLQTEWVSFTSGLFKKYLPIK